MTDQLTDPRVEARRWLDEAAKKLDSITNAYQVEQAAACIDLGRAYMELADRGQP